MSSRTYEEHFSQTEAMTPAEENLYNFLEDNFIEPLWSVYTEEKRDELDELISALKEEFYCAGKMFQKQEDKRKMEDIIDNACGTCSRDGHKVGGCYGECDKCEEYSKYYNDLIDGMKEYFI